MKKTMLICALLLALCLMLTGCITINLEKPRTDQEAQPLPAVESTELEATTSEGSPLLYEETVDDEEEYEPDLPKTIVPAVDADQKGSVRVDYVINNDLFATQMDELGYYADEYIGKNFSLIGYVSLSEEAGSRTQFAVLRDFKYPPHEHEAGEVVDHDDDEVYPVGIDCYFEGELPTEGAWVRVIGTLTDYDYMDDEGTFPALMLVVQSIETIPETEGGLRLVTQ